MAQQGCRHGHLPPGAMPGSCRRVDVGCATHGDVAHTKTMGLKELETPGGFASPCPAVIADLGHRAELRQGARGIPGCPDGPSLPGLCRASVRHHPSLPAPSQTLLPWALQAPGGSWALGCPDCPSAAAGHGCKQFPVAVGCCSILLDSQTPETLLALLYWFYRERQHVFKAGT